MSTLHLRLLGGCQLLDPAGHPLPMPPRKVRALLAYLATHPGRRFSREHLAGLLWGDSAEQRARNSLRHALARLRALLPAPVLLEDTRGLGLDGAAVMVDTRHFEALVEAGGMAELEAAVSLYEGDFLAGFELGASAFDDWALAERVRLRQRMLATLESLLAARRAEPASEPAIALAQRILALDPLREDIHRCLMRLHARAGRHAQALRQYRLCQAVLHRELGLAPAPETQQCQREILVRRQQSAAPPPVTAVPSPSPLPPLPGRERELRQLALALALCRETNRGQALLLRGEIGSGKSRLLGALEAVARSAGFAVQRVTLDAGGAPGSPAVLAELVRALVDDVDDADEIADATRLGELLGASPAPAAQTWRDSHHLLGRLLDGASARQPRLLVVEDIQRADILTLRWLAALALTTVDCPALLAMSLRLEDEPLDPEWREGLRGVPLATLDLAPLTEEQTLDLARDLSGEQGVRVRWCASRAQGNPWFLELLLAARHSDEPLPAPLRDWLMDRVATLGPVDRRSLQGAAILGHRFELAALRGLLDDPGRGVGRLLERRLLRPEGQGRYRFAQRLLCEALLAGLPAARRRAWHRRAARYFQGRDALAHAEHLAAGNDPEAAAAYLRAGREQATAGRLERAVDLAQRGLLASPDPDTEFELCLAQGVWLLALDHEASGLDELEHAAGLARDETQRARVEAARRKPRPG